MQFAIDQDILKVRSFGGSQLSKLTAKRRDRFPVRVRYLRDGTGRELSTGAAGRLILKEKGDYPGESKAEALSWKKSGMGANANYVFSLNLNVSRINALFAPVGGKEPDKVSLRMEITWNEGENWETAEDIEFEILNDYAVGDETVPGDDEENPYPPPSEIVTISGNPILTNSQHVTKNFSIPAAHNGLSVGPVTVDTGKTVTVPTGSTWLIL